MREERRILINVTNINDLGGVANHYWGLKPYWNCCVRYNSIGPQKYRKLLIPITLVKYIWNLVVFKPDMVLLNPSLGNTALIRDFFYMKIALLLHRKVSIFIHGFNLDYANYADWEWISKNLNRASHIIVLASRFREILISSGVRVPVSLSTTKVYDGMLEDFDIRKRTGRISNILFLSRIEKAKGVFEAVETFRILKKGYPNLTLTIVGDGSSLPEVKRYVKDNGINDVIFKGALSGNAVALEYKEADFFFFTSYGEGMPTVVLEAMAFGLPVITRAVGGLVDFFEDGKMGRITDSLDPADFAVMVKQFLNDEKLTKEVSQYNYKFAKEHFLASKVAGNLERILLD